MNKDYYEILELNKYATNIEIKKSYKKLALKHHPDKNQDSEESKKMFQNITEAYSVLSDEEKRKKYDMFGIENNDFEFDEDPFKMFNSIFKEHLSHFQNMDMDMNMNMNMNYEKSFDVNDIIQEMSGFNLGNLFNIPKVHVKVHSMGNEKSGTRIGSSNIGNILNSFSEMYADLNQMNKSEYQDGNKKINKDGIKKQEQNKVEELIEDINIHVNITMKEIYNKNKKEIKYQKDRYKNKKIVKKNVKFNIDVYDKEIILIGNGNETKNAKGNVNIYIHNDSKDFVRINDYDVYYEKSISLKDYYMIKNKKNIFSIQLPNDEILYLKNIEGNKLIKIQNKGIPYKKDKKDNKDDKDENYNYGNLFCCFSIVMPNEIDELYDITNELIEDFVDVDVDVNADVDSEINETKYSYVNMNEILID